MNKEYTAATYASLAMPFIKKDKTKRTYIMDDINEDFPLLLTINTDGSYFYHYWMKDYKIE